MLCVHAFALALTVTLVIGEKSVSSVQIEERIRDQVAQFMADFKDTNKYPGVKLTNAQLLWFHSIEKECQTTKGRKKRSTPYTVKQRKEYRTLSYIARQYLHEAFQAMKDNLIDGMSQYDIFVNMHLWTESPSAHGGAAFLAWHREYLWRLELALQCHNDKVMLPYWDNQLDQPLPVPSDSAIWTPSYLGNNDGAVNTGFASTWVTTSMCGSGSLHRNTVTGSTGQSYLFDDGDVNNVLNAVNYQDLYRNYDNSFEWKHGSVHVYVGGHMGYSPCSPNDPLFWMHHAYIDCLWEEYRQTTNVDPEYDYPPITEPDWQVGGPEHHANAPMGPFQPLINIHGLSDHYTNYYYTCSARPSFCETNSECGPSLLYCAIPECRCRAKVRLGGDCTGLPNHACDRTQCSKFQNAVCLSNVCTCGPFIEATMQIKDERDFIVRAP